MFSRQLLLVVVLVILLSLAPTRTEATSNQPRVLWQQKGLNNGNSPPLLITKNYLFPMNGGNILFVVNKTNGNVVFKHNFSATMQFFEQVAEHPTDPHKLYFLFSDSVYCYDIKNEATSQKPQWTFQFDNFYQNIQVAAGARYLLVYGPNAATIAFVDIKSGNKTKEIHSSGGYVISDSGAIINQRQQYGFFERIDPLTTEVMWTSTIPIFSAPSCAKNGLVAGVASAQFRNMTRQSNQSVAVLRVEDGTVAWSREIPRSDGLLPLQLNCGGSLIFAGRHEDQRVFGFNMQSGADVLEFIAKGQAFTFTVNSIRVVSNMAIFCDILYWQTPLVITKDMIILKEGTKGLVAVGLDGKPLLIQSAHHAVLSIIPTPWITKVAFVQDVAYNVYKVSLYNGKEQWTVGGLKQPAAVNLANNWVYMTADEWSLYTDNGTAIIKINRQTASITTVMADSANQFGGGLCLANNTLYNLNDAWYAQVIDLKTGSHTSFGEGIGMITGCVEQEGDVYLGISTNKIYVFPKAS